MCAEILPLYQVVVESDQGRAFAIPATGARVGRDKQNDVALPDPLLSRHHCRFEMHGTELWVVDLASANQTFVNDKPVEECRLQSGDTVRVGDTVMRISWLAATPRQPLTDLGLNHHHASPAGRHNLRPLLWTMAGLCVLAIGTAFVWQHFLGNKGALESRPVADTQEFKLEPLAGLLLLQSTPTNADVTLNGVALGKTPLVLSNLSFGTYRLRIAATGYLTKEVEAVLADRAPVRKQVDLVSDSATLTVETEAEGAVIRVNGIDCGGSPCLVERIPEGEVVVEIHASGYLPLTQKIRLAAGDTQKIRLPLAPLPAGLKIVSLPDKARVFLNNEPRGETPLELVDLAPGKYRVRVELAGCEPNTRDVELGRGDRKSEEFRLASNAGRLALITEPAHVAVFLDGRKCAETRAKSAATASISELQPVESIAAGEHELRLVCKGYADIRQTIVIEQGKTLPLHLRLERRFSPDYQVVTIRNEEWKGILDSITEEAIRLETAPGVIKTILKRDVKYQSVLREDGTVQ